MLKLEKINGKNVWDILKPVSYTHLDVYKRQVTDIMEKNVFELGREWL